MHSVCEMKKTPTKNLPALSDSKQSTPLIDTADTTQKIYHSISMTRHESQGFFNTPSNRIGLAGCGGCGCLIGGLTGYICCGPWGLFGAFTGVPTALTGKYIMGICDKRPPQNNIK